MIRDTILQINKKFLEEGKNSPQLFEDLAQLEHYIAESYGNRVLIELLQNADDAKSTKSYLYYDGKNLYFANNGKPFDESDIISISRAGSSNKDRKQMIGYRGVGFKSTTFLTSDIIIFSNNESFTFSKSKSEEILRGFGINKCPTVRIPFLVEGNMDSSILDIVNKLQNKYNTIFIFKNPQINVLKEELMNLDSNIFIFLNNITEFKVSVEDVNEFIEVSKEDTNITIARNGNKDMWRVYNGSTSENSFQIALKTDGKKLIPCSGSESVLHVFLPTLDKLGFPFKINGHFSTDPSRKHINFDEQCEEILYAVAKLIIEIVKSVFNGEEKDSSILQIITTNNSLSKFSIYFEEELYKLIRVIPMIKTKADSFVAVSGIKKPLKFLSLDEYRILINNTDNFNDRVPSIKIDNFMYDFINKFCNDEFSIEELMSFFTKDLARQSTLHNILGKIFANFINEIAQKNIRSLNVNNIWLPGNQEEYINIRGLLTKKIEFSTAFRETFYENVYKGALDYFYDNYKIDLRKFEEVKQKQISLADIIEKSSNSNNYINSNTYSTNNKGIKINISKWRSAEIQCIEIEEFLFGNKATDVSKQNKGYDIESFESNGIVRYIEVKSLNSENDSFTLTNNEYTTAHMYGERYYICLIINQVSRIKVIYIKDPINKLKMEKRVKQWEWLCEKFEGDEFNIDI